MVAERLFDLPLSGLDSMATMVTFVWDRLAYWLRVGPPGAPVTPSRAAQASEHDQDDRLTYAVFQTIRPFVPMAKALRTTSGQLRATLKLRDTARPGRGLVPLNRSACGSSHAGVSCETLQLAHEVMERLLHTLLGPDRRWPTPPTAPPQKATASPRGIKAAPDVPKSRSPAYSQDGEQALGYLGNALCTGDWNGDGLEGR